MSTCNFTKDSNGDFGHLSQRFRVFLKTCCSLVWHALMSWQGTSDDMQS